MSRERVNPDPRHSDGQPLKPPLRGRRALQAEQTRRDILDAARRRFAGQGYAATTLKDIAADASVSVQTVYDSVGGKADLVRRLNDLIDEEAGVAEIAATLDHESDPIAVAAIPARITRRLMERCGDILRAGVAASQAEPELVPLLREGQRRHLAGAESVAARLQSLGSLRRGVSPGDAARTIAALADFRLAIVMLDELEFDLDRLEAWIADTTTRSILDR